MDIDFVLTYEKKNASGHTLRHVGHNGTLKDNMKDMLYCKC